MGSYNCCGGNRDIVKINQHEEILCTVPSVDPQERENNENGEDLEKLEKFEVNFENIVNYLKDGLKQVDPIPKEDLEHAGKIKGKSDLLVIHRRYVIKVNNIGVNNTSDKDYKNLKEIRIIKKHKNKNAFIVKCNGFFLDDSNHDIIYLRYNF